MKVNIGNLLMMAIGGIVMFVVIKEVMGGQNTTTWSTTEIVLFQSIIPIMAAIGVIFGIFQLMNKIDESYDKKKTIEHKTDTVEKQKESFSLKKILSTPIKRKDNKK